MRRLVPALALAAALAASGCSKTPCQEMGERLCSCTGLAGDTCTTQVEAELKSVGTNENECQALLDSCVAPAGATLCEWLLTSAGKVACGLAVPPPATP